MKFKLFLLFIALSILLTSCSKLITIKYVDGAFVDSVNNVRYINASVSYEPIAVGEEYAKFDKTILYTMKNAQPNEWLTEEYDGIGSIYYSEQVKLPEIGEFETDIIHVCTSEILTMSLGDIEDADAILKLLGFLTDGEQTQAPPDGESFYLKCGSDSYPFLYYSLIFIKGAHGTRYLYDRGTKRCVEVGDVIDKWLPDDAAPIGEVESQLEANN